MGWCSRIRGWWYKQLTMNYGKVMSCLLIVFLVFAVVGLIILLGYLISRGIFKISS